MAQRKHRVIFLLGLYRVAERHISFLKLFPGLLMYLEVAVQVGVVEHPIIVISREVPLVDLLCEASLP